MLKIDPDLASNEDAKRMIEAADRNNNDQLEVEEIARMFKRLRVTLCQIKVFLGKRTKPCPAPKDDSETEAVERTPNHVGPCRPVP